MKECDCWECPINIHGYCTAEDDTVSIVCVKNKNNFELLINIPI